MLRCISQRATSAAKGNTKKRTCPQKTYTVIALFSDDLVSVGTLAINTWILGRIEWFGSADHANEPLVQLIRVCRREFPILCQPFVQSLADTTVSTVCTDKDVAVIGSSVGTTNHDSFLVLL